MTITLWTLWISIIILYTAMATWKLFEKAGRKQWEGFVPVYNIFIWLKVIKRPWWWAIILLIPGFSQILMFCAMNVSMGRIFGKYTAKDTLMQIFVPFIYFPMIALGKEELVYEGETDWKVEAQVIKRQLSDQIALLLSSFGIITVFVIIQKLTGTRDKPGQKSIVKEWGDSIVFALIAASLIRGYVLEAFTIPTPSMEKELLVGDFLFVNKISYGTRVPFTPLSYPLVHNTIPWTYANSYSEAIKLPYNRLPGFGKVQRNDIVVFNHPVGDTAVFGRLPGSVGAGGEIQGHNYYEFVRNNAYTIAKKQGANDKQFIRYINRFESEARERILNQNLLWTSDNGRDVEMKTKGYTHRPIDKKENYVKRCVAVPGDTLQLIDGQLYIDGKENNVGIHVNHFYEVHFNQVPRKETFLKWKDKYNFNLQQYNDLIFQKNRNTGEIEANAGYMNMSPEVKEELTKELNSGVYGTLRIDTIFIRNEAKQGSFRSRIASYVDFYPNSPNKEFNWNADNYGPLWMPSEGATIPLNEDNWIKYSRCITTYEGNIAEKKADGFYINGVKAETYTFKQNYYYMIGDNRHNSADSRMWGFVPEDHVVGKALIIWMSKDLERGWFSGGVRWERIFKTL
ncbi:MAG: signal peptidase I [Urechidicola sp.]|jgi:signal peptidase I